MAFPVLLALTIDDVLVYQFPVLLFRYPYFRSSLHGKRLLSDMLSTCTTYRGCESMLRVRTSTGIRPTGFYGAFTMENTQDVELAGVDTEQTLVVQVQHDDKLTEGKDAHFQVFNFVNLDHMLLFQYSKHTHIHTHTHAGIYI